MLGTLHTLSFILRTILQRGYFCASQVTDRRPVNSGLWSISVLSLFHQEMGTLRAKHPTGL